MGDSEPLQIWRPGLTCVHDPGTIIKQNDMKKIVILIVITFASVSCSLIGKSADDRSAKEAANVSVNDGLSYEKAVILNENNSHKGVSAEYKWLKQNYSGYSILDEKISFFDNKPYDIFTIKTKEGEEKNIYFNISAFFGSF